MDSELQAEKWSLWDLSFSLSLALYESYVVFGVMLLRIPCLRDNMLYHILEEWNPVIPCNLLTYYRNLLILHPEGEFSRSLQNLVTMLCGHIPNCPFNLHGQCDILFSEVSFWEINDYKILSKNKSIVCKVWHEGESNVKAEATRHGLKSYLYASFAHLNIAGSVKVLWTSSLKYILGWRSSKLRIQETFIRQRVWAQIRHTNLWASLWCTDKSRSHTNPYERGRVVWTQLKISVDVVCDKAGREWLGCLSPINRRVVMFWCLVMLCSGSLEWIVFDIASLCVVNLSARTKV